MDIDSEAGSPEKRIMKIVFVGEHGVGKTSLIRRFVHQNFSEFYRATIGADFAHKNVTLDGGVEVDLHLWDIAGDERFGSVMNLYYQEAVGAVVVFDVGRKSSYEMAPVWKKDIDMKVVASENRPIPCLLIGNKVDIQQEAWEIPLEKVGEEGFLKFVATSAKTGENVEGAIMELVKYIVENNIVPPPVEQSVDLAQPDDRVERKKCCS